jgi:hypothetical protein
LALLGVGCSKWSIVSRDTAARDILVPYGQNIFLSVLRGNKMVARTMVSNWDVGAQKPQTT